MLNSPLIHICALAILLLLGVFIRSRLGILRAFFIPASLIAGLVGLALGRYGLNVLPAEMLDTFSSLPSMLISIVFAPMLMGIKIPRLKEVVAIGGPQLLYGYLCDFLLIAIPLLTTVLLISSFWDVDEMFGTAIELGFVGGHGTAGGMAGVYAELGWRDGGAIGLSAATIGLLIGIIGGMIIVNHGIRRGWVSSQHIDRSGNESKTGLVPEQERIATSYLTINKDVIEPLPLQFGFVSLAVGLGAAIVVPLEMITGLSLPLFPMAMIGGLIVQLLLSRTDFAGAIDAGSMRLIQGWALELLIVSAIATIAMPVVIAYAAPLLLISAVALATLLFQFYVLGPRIFKDQWFEHAIINFGAFAGVTAVGLMLLRTIDPNLQTDAAKAYAIRSPFISPVIGGGLLTSALPVLVVTYGGLAVGLVALFAAGVCIIIAVAAGYWTKGR